MLRRLPLPACAVLVGLALTGAALGSRTAARATPKGPSLVRVVERDLHISVVHGHLTAGPVIFRVTSRGPAAEDEPNPSPLWNPL